jgi:hypothetical protein
MKTMLSNVKTEQAILERERQTYDAALADMLKSGGGQFVVIRGDEVCRMLPTYEDALEWGYAAFGLGSFLVREVSAVEPVVYMSGLSAKCAD